MAAITDLATASSAGDSDYLVVNQSGTDKKMTRTVLGLTGAGKVATGGFTLTVAATGTAALKDVANTFSTVQTFRTINQAVGNATGNINIYTTDAAATDKGGALNLGGESGQATTPWPFAGIAGRKDVAGTYAGYLQFNVASAGGGFAEAMRIDSSGNVGINATDPNGYRLYVIGNSYFSADVSALTFTDRTDFFKGDALEKLRGIATEEVGTKLDHATLPEFAKTEIVTTVTEIVDGKEVLVEKIVTGRNLGNTISLLTVAVQQLLARVEVLEAK